MTRRTKQPARRTVRRRTAAEGAEEAGRSFRRRVLANSLKAQGLAGGRVAWSRAFASPRRLAVHVTRRRAAGRRQGRCRRSCMPVSGRPRRRRPADAGAAARSWQRWALDASSRGRAEARHGRQGRSLFYDSTRQGATLAEGLQKALDEALAKLPIPKVMSYQLRRRLDRRAVRAPGARAGGAARRRRRAGRRAGPDGRPHHARPSLRGARRPIALRDADSYADAAARTKAR